ncbi:MULTISPECIES: class I SAM-dependent methyltransferase [unclassified Oleiphilus]|uniref:class I SAM-dependent methyltransferase n=1 Tax=unclassified Oleiphilus TaxID=2631174 RepID=UPI001E35B268|nr:MULTISPECIES: class I SAM-dependent methyltransferase [unclassified Oleiphilus]
MKLRSQIVPKCSGRVLEVGAGSAINLQFYDPKIVEFVWGLEPSIGMRNKAKSNVVQSGIDWRWLDLPGEQIPLDDESVDTVLLTFTLCTIVDTRTALAQMRRVLKPNGKLLFCEHGLSADLNVQKWQNRINPLWSRLAGGCQLNRSIDLLISDAGFQISELSKINVPKTPSFAGFVYMGEASVS